MYNDVLECPSCGIKSEMNEDILRCNYCGSPLNVKINFEKISDTPISNTVKDKIYGLWRYSEFLPNINPKNVVSLGEGWTPVVKADKYAKITGLNKLFFKLEYINPTGSLKDRGSTVMISRIKELRVKSVIDDSSGNAGASIAAYCGKANINCTIYSPSSTPEAKLAQASIYGAKIFRVPDSRANIARFVSEISSSKKAYYASHNLHPFFIEGMKTFAYEVFEQIDFESPIHIVFPVGGGTLFVGASKGFREMLELGWIEKRPTMHCIQSDACMPIVKAYTERKLNVEKVEERETIAGGIRIAKPSRGNQVLKILYETNGIALQVADREILQHQSLLAKCEGIFAEPTSCAALAGLFKLCQDGKIKTDDVVLVPITGFGLKDLNSVMKQ